MNAANGTSAKSLADLYAKSPESFISPYVAAKKFFVSVPTVIRWCKRFGLGFQVGGRWKVSIHKMDTFYHDQEKRATGA